MSQPLARLKEENRRALADANRLLLELARKLIGQELWGARFRAAVQAVEGIEVAGLEPYDVHESGERIDFARLSVPGDLLALAALNDQLLARRFEPTVDTAFYLVLDMTPSMAYPLTWLYAGAEVGAVSPGQIAWSKPGLTKLVAGAFLNAAAQSGFPIRLVTFDPAGKLKEVALRRPDLLSDLFEPIDQHFRRKPATPREEEARYEAVALEMMGRKGVFLFVGDFLDAAAAWPDRGRRARWLRVLNLFAEWGRRRPLLVARVNHYDEVRTVASLGTLTQLKHELGDFPVWAEKDQKKLLKWRTGRVRRKYREAINKARGRLRNQQEWAAVLSPALRSSCRGFLTVDNKTQGPRLAREMGLLWARLVER